MSIKKFNIVELKKADTQDYSKILNKNEVQLKNYRSINSDNLLNNFNKNGCAQYILKLERDTISLSLILPEIKYLTNNTFKNL